MHTKTILPTLALLVATPLAAIQPQCPEAGTGIVRLGIDENIGYAHAVRVGDMLYISGCVGWGEMPDAVNIVYDSLEKILKENGLTFADVVKENAYTTDMEALKAANSLRLARYAGQYPAATWVQVDRLFNEGLVLEVELIALIPEGK